MIRLNLCCKQQACTTSRSQVEDLSRIQIAANSSPSLFQFQTMFTFKQNTLLVKVDRVNIVTLSQTLKCATHCRRTGVPISGSSLQLCYPWPSFVVFLLFSRLVPNCDRCQPPPVLRFVSLLETSYLQAGMICKDSQIRVSRCQYFDHSNEEIGSYPCFL